MVINKGLFACWRERVISHVLFLFSGISKSRLTDSTIRSAGENILSCTLGYIPQGIFMKVDGAPVFALLSKTLEVIFL